ncbi:MAG: Rab family GTPase [Candidatus Thorarchaeota archaeon]
MEKPAFVYKICIAGDSAVGKTSAIIRWCEGFFRQEYQSTMGVQHYSRVVSIGNEKPTVVKMMIWDLAGQDIFKHLRAAFYEGAKGIVMMFDVTRQDTFTSLPNWIREAIGHVGTTVPYVIVGNKADLIPDETKFFGAAEYAQSLGVPFLLTSAKTGENIDDLFSTIGQIVHSQAQEELKKGSSWIE